MYVNVKQNILWQSENYRKRFFHRWALVQVIVYTVLTHRLDRAPFHILKKPDNKSNHPCFCLVVCFMNTII